MSLMHTPCVIVRRGDSETYDEDNNMIPSETEVETVCDLQQIRRSEPDSQGEMSETFWNCFLPVGTELTTRDSIEIEGHAYEVVGDPWDANQGSAGVNHLAVTLARTGQAVVS